MAESRLEQDIKKAEAAVNRAKKRLAFEERHVIRRGTDKVHSARARLWAKNNLLRQLVEIRDLDGNEAIV